MRWRKSWAFLIVGLWAALCGGLAAAQGGGAESILGSYYYKSIGILEILRDGNSAVTELPWERDVLEAMATGNEGETKKRMWDKMLLYRHRGSLVDPVTIEFAGFDATLNNLFEHFGLRIEDFPPEEKARFEKEFEEQFHGKSLGRYVEKWKLLSGGRLEIDGPIPIIPPVDADSFSPGAKNVILEIDRALEEAAKTPNGQPGILGTFKRDYPAACKRVCGFKIRNTSELEAWKALDAGNYADAAQLFQKAAKEQPGWPFALFGEAWARIGTNEFALARQALKNGRAALTPEYRPFLEFFGFRLEEQILAYEIAKTTPSEDYIALAESFKDKWKFSPEHKMSFDQLSKKRNVRTWDTPDFQSAAQIVRAFPLWDDLEKALKMRGRGPLLPIGTKALSFKTLSTVPLLNFLEQQTLAKISVLGGHVCLAQNDVHGAAYQYAAPIHLGQMLRHGFLISHLIGSAMENTGAQALLDLFEDGKIQDSKTLGFITQSADSFLAGEPGPELGRMFAYEGNIVPYSSDPILEYILTRMGMPNFLEASTRGRVVTARLSLLKAACEVKSKSLKPPFPAQMDAAALSEDPFAKGQKLRYIAGGGGPAAVYSVGPDQKSDRAEVSYDPSNGTTSAGDILVRIR